jgi:hypothetical protein
MKEVQNYVLSRSEFSLVWRNKTNCKPRTEFHVSFIASNCFIKGNTNSVKQHAKIKYPTLYNSVICIVPDSRK